MTHCCSLHHQLRVRQVTRLSQLYAELTIHVTDGNEYYSNQTEDDIIVAASKSRLVHKCSDDGSEV